MTLNVVYEWHWSVYISDAERCWWTTCAPCASHFVHPAHNITNTQRILFHAECPSLIVKGLDVLTIKRKKRCLKVDTRSHLELYVVRLMNRPPQGSRALRGSVERGCLSYTSPFRYLHCRILWHDVVGAWRGRARSLRNCRDVTCLQLDAVCIGSKIELYRIRLKWGKIGFTSKTLCVDLDKSHKSLNHPKGVCFYINKFLRNDWADWAEILIFNHRLRIKQIFAYG